MSGERMSGERMSEEASNVEREAGSGDLRSLMSEEASKVERGKRKTAIEREQKHGRDAACSVREI